MKTGKAGFDHITERDGFLRFEGSEEWCQKVGVPRSNLGFEPSTPGRYH